MRGPRSAGPTDLPVARAISGTDIHGQEVSPVDRTPKPTLRRRALVARLGFACARRGGRARLSALVAAATLLGAYAPDTLATAGFAEWEIFTPGGHRIARTDIHKAEHGTCLLATLAGDSTNTLVAVSHIERWRYLEGFVVGVAASGPFAFDESTRFVEWHRDLAALEAAIARDAYGESISGWLHAGDGWREAWFPMMTWRPCRALLALDEDPRGIATSPEELRELREAAARLHGEFECRLALSEDRMALYRRTTWGRACATWRSQGMPVTTDTYFFPRFCDELATAAVR